MSRRSVVTAFLMAYNPQDHYFKKAKKQNFVARSVFKLDEIDTKYRLIRAKDHVFDLGCSPGSWSQYASQKVGPEGRVLGIDLQEVSLNLPNTVFVQADLRDFSVPELLEQHGFNRPFDVVVSDMAPKTTGIKITDQARSMELCEIALDIAQIHLKPGGHFVCKFFHSSDFEVLRKRMREIFQDVQAMKPDSTRSISKEIFLIGRRKK